MQVTMINDQEQSIRWLLDNRRAELSLPEAIKILRSALHGDAKGLAILKRFEEDAAQ